MLFRTLLVVGIACMAQVANAAEDLKIWFDAPGAETINESLAIGNGRTGALIPGGIALDRISLSEDTAWAGGRWDSDNPESYPALAEARKLLFAGDYAGATKIIDAKLVCSKGPGDFGTFTLVADLELEHVGLDASKATDYRRELDLDTATARVSFKAAGVSYTREAYASAPDKVIVMRLTSSQPGKLNLSARLVRPLVPKGEKSAADGKPTPAPLHSRGDGVDGIVLSGEFNNGDNPHGMKYASRIRATSIGGTVSVEEGCIRIKDATEALLFIDNATDYRGADPLVQTASQLTAAMARSYADLLADHLNDYQRLFHRVSLSLGCPTEEQAMLPTDKRLVAFSKGNPDPSFAALYFQLGRYLLISSSRPGGMAANLQGLWTDNLWAPWSGDYHTNINVQMNYWLSETTNLAECAEPLVDLISAMVKQGTRTAQIHYRTPGWTVHTIHNIWGFTSPGNGASWGMFPMSGPWLCQHLWEHYAFSGDKAFLERVWPVMRGSGEFVLAWLVEDPKTGKLVSGPTNSPENSFVAPDGSKTSFCMGPSMDQQIAWDLFSNLLEAAKVLKIDDDFVKNVASARARLQGPKIGSDGRLMEWTDEFKEIDPHHRHVSQLFGLHPGRQFTPEHTPDLAAAARKTLDVRGDEGTGWSLAWKISFWARLQDGDRAHKLLRQLLKPVGRQEVNYSKGGGTLPNLFCSHPPMQMDGNFGATAAIAEMLMQSRSSVMSDAAKGTNFETEIIFLPALPAAWPAGEVKGLRARGGFTVDLAWAQGKLKETKIHSALGSACTLRSGKLSKKLELKAGETTIWKLE